MPSPPPSPSSTLPPAPRWADLRRRPKGDLHCHAILSAPRSAYRPLGSAAAPSRAPYYGSWSAFDTAIGRDFVSAVDGPVAFESIMDACFQHMLEDGVVYCEPSYDLALPGLLGVTADAVLEAIAAQVERWSPHIRIAPCFGLIRTLPLPNQMAHAEDWARSGVFHGVDLYGDEAAGKLESFSALFSLAARHGLARKAHAGELCGPKAIARSVELFELDQLQHGVRAVECSRTLDMLIERGIEFHVCPASNIALGLYPDRHQHPLRTLVRAGARVTVNSDDFALFGVSVSEELARLGECGLSEAEIDTIIERGLERATDPD